MSLSDRIERNVPLAPLTTFRIGGPARYFVEIFSEDDLRLAMQFAEERGLAVFILGGGSNVLVSDRGFDGLVIRFGSRGMDPAATGIGGSTISVWAGEDWDRFVEWAVGRGLGGIECLSGIPGLVGGTPIQNVGAYGQEVSETIRSVRVLRREDGSVLEIDKEDCGFAYRKSIFNTVEKDRYVVLEVTFALSENGKAFTGYEDLSNRFAGGTPTVREVRDAVREIRASKGMLVRQGGADAQSAGSFFKNPVITEEMFEELAASMIDGALISERHEIPTFPAEAGKRKVPAAWLIEKCGFPKGYRIGNAGISTLHSLAITNRGGASAQEIIELQDKLRREVAARFAIELVVEPGFVGF